MTMDMDQAYALLVARWPGRTFMLGYDLWRHAHDGGAETRTEEWSVYEAVLRAHYYGPTLEVAVEKALSCDADVTGVEMRP